MIILVFQKNLSWDWEWQNHNPGIPIKPFTELGMKNTWEWQKPEYMPSGERGVGTPDAPDHAPDKVYEWIDPGFEEE